MCKTASQYLDEANQIYEDSGGDPTPEQTARIERLMDLREARQDLEDARAERAGKGKTS